MRELIHCGYCDYDEAEGGLLRQCAACQKAEAVERAKPPGERKGGPARIQLSRRKGFKLPDFAVNVARPGRWGNPFIVGKHGTRAECVCSFTLLLGGYLDLGKDVECCVAQKAFMQNAREEIEALRGKDLACWCALDGGPCHADVLLLVANTPAGRKAKMEIEGRLPVNLGGNSR